MPSYKTKTAEYHFSCETKEQADAIVDLLKRHMEEPRVSRDEFTGDYVVVQLFVTLERIMRAVK